MSPFDSIYAEPKEQQTPLENSNLFQASSRFIQDTYQHPEARARQASALVDGCVVGGMPLYHHQELSDRFDRLFLHLHRMFDENLEDLVPETSVAKINEQLAALKKM